MRHATTAAQLVTVSYCLWHYPVYGLDTQGSVRRDRGTQSVDTYTGHHIQVEKSLLWQQPAKAKARRKEAEQSVHRHVGNERECEMKIKNVWKRWEKMSVSAYLCGTAEVIVIDLFYGLEVDHTLQLGLMFVCGKEGRKKNNTSLVKRLKCIDHDRLFLGCNSWGTSPHVT